MSATRSRIEDGDSGPGQTAATDADAAVARVGAVSAWITFVLACLYVPTIVGGFIAAADMSKPLPDPFLAVAEGLIVLMAPPLVGLAGALYLGAPIRRRIWGLGAFGFTLLLAGTTECVHLVELTVARRLAPGPPTGPIFGWEWPGLLYGIDVVAWDLFFGIALVCASLTLPGQAARWPRRLLLAAGVLSLAGLVGPAVDAIALRMIGIFGYAVVFPVAAALLARLLDRRAHSARPLSDPVRPVP